MVSYRNYLRKKKSFNKIKNCKKVEIVCVLTSSYNYYLTRVQRWSPGNNLLGQGKGLQKKSEAKAKDLLVKDRPSRGQSHGPGTQFF